MIAKGSAGGHLFNECFAVMSFLNMHAIVYIWEVKIYEGLMQLRTWPQCHSHP